ncbi:MAG: lipoyl(octanoyl) transferase LipB [Deltaproteobacteria bacterium]|nr:lipoyl(octanoyl) transferase LipB [Deltaproteobacteria bacterium]
MLTAQKAIESAVRADGVKNIDSYRTLTVAWLSIVEYDAALELQNFLASARLRDDIGDILLLLEHPHVYTLGRGADERFVLNPAGIPVYRVSRGGQVTYHGPGQLIGYPIIKFEGTERDVIRYLRQLEQVLIEALAMLEIVAQRRAGLTGVWVGQAKIASIGVGFRRWVSLHGFALNVSTDLRFFDAIVPCGITDCRMTSIAAQRLEAITSEAAGQIVASQFAAVFGYQRILRVCAAELSALVNPAAHAGEVRR